MIIVKLNTMERKSLLLILSGLILGGFFMPFVRWDEFTMSGFDMMVSSHPPEIKYILVALPVTALYLIVTVLGFDEGIRYNKLILSAPLIAIAVLFSVLCLNTESRASVSIDPLDTSSLGLWIAIVASVILAGLRKRREAWVN